jgi:hypothetical protein
MTQEELIKLSKEIDEISSNFENKPWTENRKLLKKEFNIGSINSPNNYLKTLSELEEVIRETRLLFLYSVFNIVCKEEGKLYDFDSPFQAGMRYTAIMKKEDTFYLLDQDGDLKEMFVSENFVQFVDDTYWELYEQE